MNKLIIFILIALTLATKSSPTSATQGAATYGCQNDYREIKDEFEKLYKANKFHEAYNVLYSYLISCDWIGFEESYWIYSDLAITAYKMGDPATCLKNVEHADELRRQYEHGYSSEELAKAAKGSEQVWKALDYNRKLCKNALDKQKRTEPTGQVNRSDAPR